MSCVYKSLNTRGLKATKLAVCSNLHSKKLSERRDGTKRELDRVPNPFLSLPFAKSEEFFISYFYLTFVIFNAENYKINMQRGFF